MSYLFVESVTYYLFFTSSLTIGMTLYFRQTGSLNFTLPVDQASPGPENGATNPVNMPQPGGGAIPRATATVHPYNVDTRQINVSREIYLN